MHHFHPTTIKSIHEIKTFETFLQKGFSLHDCTLYALDFSGLNINWDSLKVDDTTTFLGCKMTIEEEIQLRRKGAFIYQHVHHLPYNPYRDSLYTWQELMQEKEKQTVDYAIYTHFEKSKFNPTITEALSQRIHDHAVDESLRDLLGTSEDGMMRKHCVAFMGGHGTLRTDEWYRKTAMTAKLVAENDYFVVSGGGPGIMEATNLGAYFAGRSDEDLEAALAILAEAPHYSAADFNAKAQLVLEKYPTGTESLAIPTWFYGHEPSNLFASHIAKYFSNSIREDTLLAIALYGIVFAPGSAGTTQEIFQDATQNHYVTFNYLSPMVFLSQKRYEVDTLIYPLLRQLSYGHAYHDMLTCTDEPTEVLAFLEAHPPKKIA